MGLFRLPPADSFDTTLFTIAQCFLWAYTESEVVD